MKSVMASMIAKCRLNHIAMRNVAVACTAACAASGRTQLVARSFPSMYVPCKG